MHTVPVQTPTLPLLGIEEDPECTYPKLFRAVGSTQVLSGFASVFGAVLDGQVAAGDTNEDAAEAVIEDPTFIKTPPAERRVHGAADDAWNSSKVCETADGFVSHVWVAGRWVKAAALLLMFNLQLAVSASLLSFVSTILFVFHSVRWDWAQADLHNDSLLQHKVIYFPMAVFAVVLCFGQRLTCSVFAKNLWVDKLCIHQTRLDIKVKGVSIMHEFVQRSNKLYVLWSQTYFERLWCTLELAMFSTLCGSQNVVFLPLWHAPFILLGFLMSVITVFALGQVVWIVGLVATWAYTNFGPNCAQVLAPATLFAISWMPALVPMLLVFRYKITCAEDMYKQFHEFSLRKTKCFMESDRAHVYKMVMAVWGTKTKRRKSERWAKPVDESQVQRPRVWTKDSDFERQESVDELEAQELAIERFDKFVSQDLKEHVVSKIGDVSSLTYGSNLLVHLPLLFWMAWDLMACDGANCMDSAQAQGMDTWQYGMQSLLGDTIFYMLILPWMYPAMLASMHWVSESCHWCSVVPLQILAMLLVSLVNSLVMGLNALTCANFIMTWDPSWMAFSIFMNCMLVYVCFFRVKKTTA